MCAKKEVAIRLPWKIPVSAALLILVLFGLSQRAAAKGPASATISGSGIEGTLELMGEDNWAQVSKLMEQTGLWYATGDLPRPIEAPAGELGPAYTLTWVNGGPPGKSMEERTMVQYLYLHAENGPLIHTPRQDSLENWGQERMGWFTAPEGLSETLQALGVPASEAAPGVLPGGAWWIVGAAGVVVAAGLASLVAKRRRASRTAPRQATPGGMTPHTGAS